MPELIITIMLFLPSPTKAISWDVGAVHNQVTLMHKNGIEVSYSATQVPCHTVAIKTGFAIYHSISMRQEVCYLTDLRYPVFVRHKSHWFPTTHKTYRVRE